MVELRKPVSEKQEMGVKIISQGNSVHSWRNSYGDAEEAENFRTIDRVRLLTMKQIEDVKRELRKALGLDPLDKTFDRTKFKVQSDKSKSIGGAAKFWLDRRFGERM